MNDKEHFSFRIKIGSILLCLMILAGCSENLERLNPKKYLEVHASSRQNIFGKWIIQGNIENKAKETQYKNIEIEIEFLSKTKTVLKTEKQIIYEYFPPGENKYFKLKLLGPKQTSNVKWKIINAHPS